MTILHPTLRTMSQAMQPKLNRLKARMLSTGLTGGYTARFAWEEVLRAEESGNSTARVTELIRASRWKASGPFNSLMFTLYCQTGDPIWLTAFVQEASVVLTQSQLSSEGAWMHSRGRYGDGFAVLIDSFQEEASRLVKLAWLGRRGDRCDISGDLPSSEALEDMAVAQFQMHRSILRDSESGLWHNGRGWLTDPAELSPGFWSRGQGWLMRGLCETMQYLSRDAPRRETITGLAQELAVSLLATQRENGMWPALLQVPESPPEASGSALISGSLLLLMKMGLLDPAIYEEPVEASLHALLNDYLDEDGTVHNACPGPGPLVSMEAYQPGASFPANEPHGIAAYLFLNRALNAAVDPDCS